jgi:hypothetical protein
VTRRRRSLLTLLLASSVALVAAAPAAASHCRSSSTSNGARIVLRSSEAVVFTKRGFTYGCLFRPGNVHRLPEEGGDIHDFRLSGRFVAYATAGSGIGDEFDRVYVFDLRTGRLFNSYSGTFVSTIVVKRNGSVAWIQASVVRAPAGSGQTWREVRKGEAGAVGEELLDRSATIVASSLALSADRRMVTWTRDGQQRSAPID